MQLLKGIYEQVINEALEAAILDLDSGEISIEKEKIDVTESESILSRYMQQVLERGLRFVKERAASADDDHAGVKAEIAACNLILEQLSHTANQPDLLNWRIGKDGEELLSVWDRKLQTTMAKNRPLSSIAISSIFTGSKKDPTLAYELSREIETADRIDFLVSFIKYSGIIKILDALTDFTQQGKHLRIITTTYMGNTDPIAIEKLADLPNTEIKISYDTRSTRLHAKSYIFHRDNGFTTAFVGSSNLSGAAITDGMEWNLKITNADMPQVIESITATFDSYWNSPDFETYDVDQRERLRAALKREQTHDLQASDFGLFDIHPYKFQSEILEDLQAEREIHHSYRNLVVAATGTGKTVVSAFDYKRFVLAHPNQANRFLYIVHREDILKKSLNTYRAILRDPNFGALCTGNETPSSYDHVFMTIQTFESRHFDQLVEPQFFDYIVVDESHHGAAASYQKVFEHFQPQIMLGLTATPERTDGLDILHYFNSRIASEIRLPEAIDRELLAPFQYYGVTDPVDVSQVKFVRGRYDTQALEDLYVKRDDRIAVIAQALQRYCPDTEHIKGLGFCVSKAHAIYMAQKFNAISLPSAALTADTPWAERDALPGKLVRGELRFIFTVDIYNEGVDIPEVNTELMLRPTESLTIFIQQLGRGLRKSDNKTELTVLDLVGQANRNYRIYEKKLRYMTSGSEKSLKKQMGQEFEGLPLGCYIKLEKVAQQTILDNINTHVRTNARLIEMLREYHAETGQCDLGRFLQYDDMSLDDLYIHKVSFTMLAQQAGIRPLNLEPKSDGLFAAGLRRLEDIDSQNWIEALQRFFTSDFRTTDELDLKMAAMLYYTFYTKDVHQAGFRDIPDFLDRLSNGPYRDEILALLALRYDQLKNRSQPIDLGFPAPLDLHCTYTRNQILAAFGEITGDRYYTWQEGVKELKGRHTDLFTIDLKKAEKDFSPTTRYEDYAISSSLFHWQSQSGTARNSPVGQRYLHQRKLGQNVLLFVRAQKSLDGKTLPYTYLGKADYVSSEGDHPINIVWQMKNEMPTWVLERSSAIRQ